MNEQQLWEMSRDGRLESFARDNPLGFSQECESLIEEVVKTDESFLRRFQDQFFIKYDKWEYDFDRRTKLAKDAPEIFKFWRTRLLSAEFRLAINTQALTRLQWRIDMEIKRHKNPLGACVSLIRMMNERMWGENGLHEALNNLRTATTPKDPETTQENCSILPFKKS